MPRIIGLTGGIATGKSTVSATWRDAGAVIIDADAIARDVVKRGSPALRLIRWRFGPGVLQPSGALDRAALGRVVFSDERARAALNRIMHPFIMLGMARRAALAVARLEPLVVFDAPLLFESGTLVPFCGATVVVRCAEDEQLARLLARSRKEGHVRLNPDEARDRVRAQMPLADKAARADHVLENDGSVAELDARARELLHELRPSPAGELAFRALACGVLLNVVRAALRRARAA